MSQYKFIKQVTLDGTWKDGHVPTPTRTFNVGEVIEGIFSPASSYPLTKRASIYFTLPNGETYETQATNFEGNFSEEASVANNNNNNQTRTFFTPKNIIIGVVLLIVLVGILKLTKVF